MGSELPSNESELGSFAVLPREIRDKIYAYALTIPARGFSKPYHSYHPSKQDLWRLERQSGLWIVCTSRQIHAESLPVLYQRNTFVLSVDDATSEATDVKLHRAGLMPNSRPSKLNITYYDEDYCRSFKLQRINEAMLRHMRRLVLKIDLNSTRYETWEMFTTDVTQADGRQITLRSIVSVVDDACKIMASCDRLDSLTISFVVLDEPERMVRAGPSGMKKLLAPLFQVNCCRRVRFETYQMAGKYLAINRNLEIFFRNALARAKDEPFPGQDHDLEMYRLVASW